MLKTIIVIFSIDNDALASTVALVYRKHVADVRLPREGSYVGVAATAGALFDEQGEK